MPTKQVQIRRGTASQVALMTPAEGEPIADLTNDRINLGDGVRAGGYPLANFRDVQTNAFGFATAGGTADAITLTLNPPLLAYVPGTSIEFTATNTTTGASTIDVNGLGVVDLKRDTGAGIGDTEAGTITAGVNYRITYRADGDFQIMSGGGSGASASGLVFLGSVSASAGSIDLTSLIDNSKYTDYKIVYRDIVKNSTASILIRISENNGSSYIAANYGESAATDNTVSSTPAASGITANVSSVSTTINKGEVDIFGTDVAQTTFLTKGFSYIINNTVQYTTKSGVVIHSNPINAVRIVPSLGTITSGSASIYGYAK